MFYNKKNTLSVFIFLFLSLFQTHVFAFAQDLEESPDEDLEAVDKAASEFSMDMIKALELRVLESPPTIDGNLTDKFWASSSILSIDLEMYPERFAKAKVATDALIGVTQTHVYFAFNAYDNDLSKLRTAVRDEDGVKDDDYVSVVIDPTGNLRRKYEFRVNPSGSKSDVLQNTVSDRYIYDWDTSWEAAAQITEKGWLVEMAIPIDSLKQPSVDGDEKNQWAVILKRSYPRQIDRTMGGIYLITPPNPAAKERIVTTNEQGQVEEDVTQNLELHPYAIWHPAEKRKYKASFEQDEEIEETEAGMDLSLTIDSATKISATINPNFTEVEADIARDSINNPFNVFQPEKRRFFQEDMDLYSTLMPLVYTRNIINPDLGVSVSHETKESASGSFWARDTDTEVIMPDNLGSEKVEITGLENESMAARYVTAGGGSAYGVLGTVRTADDYKNGVIAFDSLVNLGIDDKLRYQVMFSQTEYPINFAQDLCDGDDCLDITENDNCELGYCDTNTSVLRAPTDETLEDYAIQVKYKHTGPKSLFWANYFDVGKDFRADLGFVKRTDYKLYNIAYGRNWYFETLSGDGGKSRGRVYLVATQVESQKGEKIETGYDLWAEFRGSYQTVFRPGFRIKERAVNRIQQNTLDLKANAPKFDEQYFQWYLETSPFPAWTFNLDGKYGEIADAENIVLGDMQELKPRIRYQIGDFNFSVQHTYRNFDYEDSMLYKENFSTYTVNWRPDDKRVLRFLVKYDDTDRDINRWRGDELSFEREVEAELTYSLEYSKNLTLLSGLKYTREKDNEIGDDFTSKREIYLRMNYRMGFIGK
ncbi:DUF5916 domain-containing protein [Thalassomonas sp. M1454]|uniref:DUF5916 domain-containing protein n=1 Tax=Thalassomonas sp. M1454 TaxID=2594477 RepID=UPI0011801048|nr:DUF5916 domain-containing protein [Thalassomonas sp. M1454]TRX55744.1 hypothetical protein FNN08_08945 [Thalassomonas sp. M1454]